MNQIIKLIAEIEIEIDGELDKEKAVKIMTQRIPEGISSEDYDGTDDWVIFVNHWTVREDLS